MPDRPSHVALIGALALALSSCAALSAPKAVDGLTDDWTGRPACVDPAGDGSGVDVRAVWIRGDSERLTLRLELQHEIGLQAGNALTLLIDGDADPATGAAADGVGAELVWTFGEREGALCRRGERTVDQSDVGLIQAPTVTSDEFEISFLRYAVDGTPIAPGPTVAVVVIDAGGPNGDRAPDEGPLSVALGDAVPPGRPVRLDRDSPDDVRVLTWNVLFDGLFKRPAPFLRVLRAIDPDVICFQEIWSHTARQAADQVSLALPGSTWYGESTSEGIIVSRYPLVDASPIDEAGNYWALVDLPDDRYGVDLSVVSAHPPCCENESGRQRELDGIAAWLRDLAEPGEREIPPGTPTVVAGDMNLVGGSRQLRTLLAGEIVDERGFGPSRAPDWDGTPLADTWPRLAGGWDVFTWRDERSSFAPGKLDYIVYSDSVLRLGNAFVLATEKLPAEALEAYGLRPADTLDASDHLPVVADFTPVDGRSRREAVE